LDDFFKARWYTLRRAGSTKPATYRCPLCGKHLSAMSDHLLVFPEDDRSRRRHAHIECVKAAGLPRRSDVEPPRPSLLARLLRRSP